MYLVRPKNRGTLYRGVNNLHPPQVYYLHGSDKLLGSECLIYDTVGNQVLVVKRVHVAGQLICYLLSFRIGLPM